MSYTTRTAVEARVPKALVVRALDRNEDGSEDSGAWEALTATVETEIDGLLAGAYTVPFAAPVPAAIEDAALVLTCDALYVAIATPPKDNPWAPRAAAVRERLRLLGQGEGSLDTGIAAAPDYGVDEPDLEFDDEGQAGL